RIRRGLIEILIERAGGPRRYSGPAMRPAHAGQAITDAEFDAFMANLAGGLDDLRVGGRERAEVLAIFASMRPEVVEPPVAGAAARLERLERSALAIERRLAAIEERLDALLARPGAPPDPATGGAAPRAPTPPSTTAAPSATAPPVEMPAAPPPAAA